MTDSNDSDLIGRTASSSRVPHLVKTFLILLLLATINASFLYFHQWTSEYWLPKTEPGKWRQGLTQMWRRSYAESITMDMGYVTYTQLPAETRTIVDARVDEKYPPAQMLKIERRNDFRDYVSAFGMWQWPLTLAATLIGFAVLLRHQQEYVYLTIPACIIAVALHADAWYRSYFGALGW